MRLLSTFAASLLLLTTADVRAERLTVVTTIETFAALARAVGGDRVSVESLSRGYQDPHFVEAKPSLLVTLSRADLLVHVGLDLESGWLPPLLVNSRNARIQSGARGNLDASTVITPLDVPSAPVSRAHGDIHPRGNPHYWIPPVNALRVARAIAERLSAIDPAGAPTYAANVQAFGELLKSKAPAWSARAEKLKGVKVATFHKSWSYVSSWLGLIEVGYVEDKPGIAPNPQHVARLIQSMKAQSVPALLVESYYDRSIASVVADKAGARLVPMPSNVGATPEIATYPDLVDAVLARLEGSLHQ